MPDHAASYNADEVAKFQAMAAEWWDPNGKFKPLHELNPTRLEYITSQIALQYDRNRATSLPFDGLRVLDIGCGGGLLCEPLARLGATVVGIDPADRNIPVAKLHAEQSDLEIDYRNIFAEDLLASNEPLFDVVLAMEVVEHVEDPQEFIKTCAALVKPNGILIMSTLNRNPKSYAMAIIGAEYILRWLPKGTHEWEKFIKPDELSDMIANAALDLADKRGMVFNPLKWTWGLSFRDLSVNYVMTAIKPKSL